MKKLNKIEQEVIVWNNRFPIDRWWREKHKVPFMSKIHRESSFIDQLFEWTEEQMMNDQTEEYKPNIGDFIQIDEQDKNSIINSLRDEFEREFLDG